MAFVAWGAVAGRSAEIAAALNGHVLCLFPPDARWRPPAPVRYVLGALRTSWWLARHRPQAVIVTNPPVFAGLVVLAFGRLRRATVVLDSHPSSFGAQGDKVSARLVFVHRWMARRVSFSMVAADVWRRIVESWGAEALVVHEAPGDADPAPATTRQERLRVLYVGRLGPDEPYQVVLEAARLKASCDVVLTGDPSGCPEHLRQNAPSNVEFVGFLAAADYRRQLERADVVLTLTTEPGSVMRAAYEAVYANRPLIVSDWPLNKELFPFALHVDHRPEDVARALGEVDRRHRELLQAAPAARELQLDRWEVQRRALVARLAPRTPGEMRPGPAATGAAPG